MAGATLYGVNVVAAEDIDRRGGSPGSVGCDHFPLRNVLDDQLAIHPFFYTYGLAKSDVFH